MSAEVTVTIQGMGDPTMEVIFRGRTICTVGRAEDCEVRLPNDMLHLDVSRHHCLLDIDPPEVRVRDLGSKNGTFVNGTKIGQRAKHQPPEEADVLQMPEWRVQGGDEIKVGHTVLHIAVSGNAECAADAEAAPAAQEVPAA